MEENPYQSPASDGTVQARISEPIHVSGRLTYEDYWAIGGMYGQSGKWQRRFTWWGFFAVVVLMMVQTGRYWYVELRTHTVLEILAAIRISTYLLCILPLALLAGSLGIIWWARWVGKAASAAGEGIYAGGYGASVVGRSAEFRSRLDPVPITPPDDRSQARKSACRAWSG